MMSLMSRRLPVGPVGTHGSSTQVSWRCSDLSSDMKSHTANTWCSMNVVIASWVSSARVDRVRDHPVAGRRDASALSFSIPGWVSPQS